MLSTSKVLAGSLAAATSAVLGSYFGAFGTVGGAAAGAVVTSLSTEFYHRSIERTAARLRPRARAAQPTEDPSARKGVERRRGGLLAGTLLIFALGIGVVTGIEWATGGPLSGGAAGSTSLGDVLRLSHTPIVGDLLEGTPLEGSSDHSSSRHHPGLVGELLSNL